MTNEYEQALLEDLISELNDPKSLTRDEITAAEALSLIPEGEYLRQVSLLDGEINYLNKHAANASKQINGLAAQLQARNEENDQ